MTRGPVSESPLPHWFQSDGGKKLLLVDLPSLESLQGVDLDVSGSEVRLQLPGSDESLRIPLPSDLAAVPETAAARFSRKRRQLTIAWDLPAAAGGDPEAPEASADPVVSSALLADRAAPEEDTSTPLETPGVAELGWIEKAPESEGAAAQREEEARPCLEALQEEVEHALKQCTIEKFKSISELKGCTVLLGGFAVKGEATMTGRSCRFKVSVSSVWEVLDAFGGQLGASGTVSVPELTEGEVSPRVVVRTSPGGAAQARAVAEWMKRRGAELIAVSLNGESLAEAVAAACKPEVESCSGSVAQNKCQAQKGAPEPGRRFLEDQCMAQWAETWLKKKLGGVTVRLFGGLAVASLGDPQVSGRASVSGSVAAPTASFQLSVTCSWVVRPSTAGAKEIRGTLCIPEFMSEQGAKDCLITVEAAPGQKAIGQFLAAFKQNGVAVVRSLLEQFVTELQAAAA